MPKPFATPFVLTSQMASISGALEIVNTLRDVQRQSPELLASVTAIKSAQIRRFRYTYKDVLSHADMGPAAGFFLSELYDARDFSDRDHQFGRVVPTMQRLFPKSVVDVASTLARLHAISEQLDHAMAIELLRLSPSNFSLAAAMRLYVEVWRSVGNSMARSEQLVLVQRLGDDLAKLTRKPGLRTMLKLMRTPAQVAGLQHLQSFLELGFDTFFALQRSPHGASDFLLTIQQRETQWIKRLFDTEVTFRQNPQDWPELESFHN
jgi:hypothetical protein